MRPVQSSGPSGSRISCIFSKSRPQPVHHLGLRHRRGTPSLPSLTFCAITASPCGGGTSPVAASGVEGPEVALGGVDDVSDDVARRPAGAGGRRLPRLGAPGHARTSARPRRAPRAGWCPCPRTSWRSTRSCPHLSGRPVSRAAGTSSLVELVTGEVHQRIAEQLDLDAVGVLEVHRLLDARDPGRRSVTPASSSRSRSLLPPVARHRDRDVLHAADRLDARLEPEPGEVEEAEQRLVARGRRRSARSRGSRGSRPARPAGSRAGPGRSGWSARRRSRSGPRGGCRVRGSCAPRPDGGACHGARPAGPRARRVWTGPARVLPRSHLVEITTTHYPPSSVSGGRPRRDLAQSSAARRAW